MQYNIHISRLHYIKVCTRKDVETLVGLLFILVYEVYSCTFHDVHLMPKGSFIDAVPNQPSITNLQLSKTEMAFSLKARV